MDNERRIELFENILSYLTELIDDDDELTGVLLRNKFSADEVNESLFLMDDEQVVCLCTFPCSDSFYCKTFYVRKGWLLEKLEFMDSCNENKGVDLDNFLEEYVWDETWAIYQSAKGDYRILYEEDQL